MGYAKDAFRDIAGGATSIDMGKGWFLIVGGSLLVAAKYKTASFCWEGLM